MKFHRAIINSFSILLRPLLFPIYVSSFHLERGEVINDDDIFFSKNDE